MANAEVAVLPTGPFKFVCFLGGKNIPHSLFISPIDDEEHVPMSHKDIAEAAARKLGMLPHALLSFACGGACMVFRGRDDPEGELKIRYVGDSTELRHAQPKDFEEALLAGVSEVVFEKRGPIVRKPKQHLSLII